MEIVEQVEAQQMMMLPPTYLTSLQLAQFETPDAALAAARDRRISMFMPEVVSEGEEFVLSRPEWARELLAARG